MTLSISALVAFAATRHHYEDVPEFFTHDFHSKHYKDTKNAVQAKLQSLFASGKFARLTCGPSTFMLEKAIEERKVIIFNLAEGSLGEQESSAFGRLLVSMLQGIAVRRDKQNKRIPTRVLIMNFTISRRVRWKISLRKRPNTNSTLQWHSSRSAKARRRK